MHLHSPTGSSSCSIGEWHENADGRPFRVTNMERAPPSPTAGSSRNRAGSGLARKYRAHAIGHVGIDRIVDDHPQVRTTINRKARIFQLDRA